MKPDRWYITNKADEILFKKFEEMLSVSLGLSSEDALELADRLKGDSRSFREYIQVEPEIEIIIIIFNIHSGSLPTYWGHGFSLKFPHQELNIIHLPILKDLLWGGDSGWDNIVRTFGKVEGNNNDAINYRIERFHSHIRQIAGEEISDIIGKCRVQVKLKGREITKLEKSILDANLHDIRLRISALTSEFSGIAGVWEGVVDMFIEDMGKRGIYFEKCKGGKMISKPTKFSIEVTGVKKILFINFHKSTNQRIEAGEEVVELEIYSLPVHVEGRLISGCRIEFTRQTMKVLQSKGMRSNSDLIGHTLVVETEDFNDPFLPGRIIEVY